MVTYDHIAQSGYRLLSEYGDKVTTDRLILAMLLTQPSRIALQVLRNPGVRTHDNLAGSECELLEIHTLTSLMWSPDKNYTIGRKFDRTMVFQSAFSSSVGVNKSLL
jgi:hypothetical protein